MKENIVYLKYKKYAKDYKLDSSDTRKLWKIIEPIATHEEFIKRSTDPYYHHDIKTLGDHILCDTIVTYKLANKLRKDKKDFSLKDLYGKEILVGRSSGMPALNFLNALKNEEIDKNKIKINYNIDFASLSGAFIGNTGDYVNLFEPTALKLENEGYGYVLQSIGLLSGEMPYTTFYARKSYIENNKEIIKSFTKAINKGLEFVKNNDEMKIAKSIYKQFPDLSLNDLSTIIKRYKDADSFLDSSYIEEKLLVNLENLLIDNNLLKDYVPYNDLIIEVK